MKIVKYNTGKQGEYSKAVRVPGHADSPPEVCMVDYWKQ